jgi:N-acetyl-gamma-glutamyl-phosphate reductase
VTPKSGTKLRVAVAGGTGYMGAELLRLLALHPRVDVRRVTSEQYAGKLLGEVYPSFRGVLDVRLEELDAGRLAADVDVVFSGLPHGAAAATVVEALKSDVVAFDLSADFRLRDAAEFRRWYGEHPAPELLAEAVYGIPELARDRIRQARIVAVPGCYPTGALLGIVPLVRAGLVEDGAIVVDSKSGASGAGRAAKTELLFGEVQENVRAYGVGKHRHLPEIVQQLAADGCRSPVVFVPHLLPIRRGILSTIYVPLSRQEDLAPAFARAFTNEPFVSLLGEGRFPEVRDVRGTNRVQIGWTVLPSPPLAIVVTAIDNLGKGGSGQAVQCLNVRFGFEETTGLEQIAAVP